MRVKRMGWVWAFAMLLIAAFTITAAASAQEAREAVGASTPTTTGAGGTIDGTDIDGVFRTKTGGGIGLSVGVGITPLLSVYASLDAARKKSAAEAYIGEFGIAQIDAGARLNEAADGSERQQRPPR